MKIGNGSLDLAIVGVCKNSEISAQELENLARAALNIRPLTDILNVQHIELINQSAENGCQDNVFLEILGEEMAQKIKKENNFDIIAIIKRLVHSRYDDFVYSDINPQILAHELGHSLGLTHPSFYLCGLLCKESQQSCLYFGDIMGCGFNGQGRNKGFSPNDIVKLKRWYLQ